MKKINYKKLINEFPDLIDSPILMKEANEPISIYKGQFSLQYDKVERICSGKIMFEWLPNPGVRFEGFPLSREINLTSTFDMFDPFSLIINGLLFGEGFLTKISTEGDDEITFIRGTLSREAILGDKTIPVSKLKYSIPNLREFWGLPTKKIKSKKITRSISRLQLDSEKYTIILDKRDDYKRCIDSLKLNGGYFILYGGEIESKTGSIIHNDIKDLIYCFNTFITFLNGRRTSACFIHGTHNDKTIWCDYTHYFVDDYKEVTTWPQRHSIVDLNQIWNNFMAIWNHEDDKSFLRSAVHWYVESNGHLAFSEGSIIMAQTALELIYNWWLVEKKELIRGNDSAGISASNKIRLLLSQLNISNEVPVGLKNLHTYILKNKILDAPEAIVQIRNALVHSQEEKRKSLTKVDSITRYEALQLSIWYFELSMLKILNYNSKYYNRCSKEKYAYKVEELVPWIPDDN